MMKAKEYKNKVKGVVKDADFQYLIQIKTKHKKISQVPYNNLSLQEYMQSPLFTAHDAALLFVLRTRRVRVSKMILDTSTLTTSVYFSVVVLTLFKIY